MARSDYPPILDRRTIFISSWRNFAPNESFGGMTLTQFEEATAETIAVRHKILVARTKLSGLMLDRSNADEATREAFIRVADGVRANADHGYDCPMYRALGYVPKSESKTGRRRTKTVYVTTPPVE